MIPQCDNLLALTFKTVISFLIPTFRNKDSTQQWSGRVGYKVKPVSADSKDYGQDILTFDKVGKESHIEAKNQHNLLIVAFGFPEMKVG